jgi:hypothetical protein
MSGLGYTLRYFAADLTPLIVFLLVFLARKNIYLRPASASGFRRCRSAGASPVRRQSACSNGPGSA